MCVILVPVSCFTSCEIAFPVSALASVNAVALTVAVVSYSTFHPSSTDTTWNAFLLPWTSCVLFPNSSYYTEHKDCFALSSHAPFNLKCWLNSTLSYVVFVATADVTACVKNLTFSIDIEINGFVAHVATLDVFAFKQTSCARFAPPFVAFATVTVAIADFVACLGTTAIVYTVWVSIGAVAPDSTFDWVPIS